MTRRLKCEKRRKLSDVDGDKLRISETSGRKHSGELDVESRQEIKKGSLGNEDEERGDLSKCASPHARSLSHLLLLMIPHAFSFSLLC